MHGIVFHMLPFFADGQEIRSSNETRMSSQCSQELSAVQLKRKVAQPIFTYAIFMAVI